MGREAGRPCDDLFERVDPAATVLVVGEDDDAHSRVCTSLVERAAVEHPLRLCLDAACDLPHVTADGRFENGPGEYDDLSLSQAGIVATEAIQNLGPTDAGGANQGVHACLCGFTDDETPAGRRAAFEFLHALTRELDSFGGGLHVHVPAAPGGAFPELLAPLFDEVIELRDGPEARRRDWNDTDGAWRAFT